jgi:membrane associated rhomboid family serine protease
MRNSGYGGPAGGFSLRRARFWSVTIWLIAINVAVYVVGLVFPSVYDWGTFSASQALYHGQVWRCITYQFLHFGPMHLFVNMLGLYFFGPIVESSLGKPRYLAFYLLCGCAGAAGYLLLWKLHVLIYSADSELIGASAAIFGVLVAAAKLDPHSIVRVFGIFPMRLRTMVLCFIGLAALTVLQHGANAGGEASHLGGAAAGWLLMRNRRWLNIFDRTRRGKQRFWRPGDPAENFFRRDVRGG